MTTQEERRLQEGGDLQEAVLALVRTEDGKRKLSCAEALGLAQERGVEPKAVTRICNRLSIKINGCQLGCFQ